MPTKYQLLVRETMRKHVTCDLVIVPYWAPGTRTAVFQLVDQIPGGTCVRRSSGTRESINVLFIDDVYDDRCIVYSGGKQQWT
jgi:hypothetical protein